MKSESYYYWSMSAVADSDDYKSDSEHCCVVEHCYYAAEYFFAGYCAEEHCYVVECFFAEYCAEAYCCVVEYFFVEYCVEAYFFGSYYS